MVNKSKTIKMWLKAAKAKSAHMKPCTRLELKGRGSGEPLPTPVYYVKEETPAEMLPNLPDKAARSVGIAVTSIRPIAAAIKPYSMAVAPDSSLKNFFMLKLQFTYSTCPKFEGGMPFAPRTWDELTRGPLMRTEMKGSILWDLALNMAS
jgi:hypothetical protein